MPIQPTDLIGLHDGLRTTKLLRLELIIPGTPAGSGSKSSFVARRSDGSVVFRDDDPMVESYDDLHAGHLWRVHGQPVINTADAIKGSAKYRRAVAKAASAVYTAGPLTCPVFVTRLYFYRRLAAHLGTGRNIGTLKPSAPAVCMTGHDIDKLDRSIHDGLEGVVYVNDRQVAGGWSGKRWIDPDTFADERDWLTAGDFAFVRVEEIDTAPAMFAGDGIPY